MGNRGFCWILLDFPDKAAKQSFVDIVTEAQKGREEFENIKHPAFSFIEQMLYSWHPRPCLYKSDDEFRQHPYVLLADEPHPAAAVGIAPFLIKVYPKAYTDAQRSRVIDRFVIARDEANWHYHKDVLKGIPGGVQIVLVELVEYTPPRVCFFRCDSHLDEWIARDDDWYEIAPVGRGRSQKRVVYIDWERANATATKDEEMYPPISGEIDPLRHHIAAGDGGKPAGFELDQDLLTLLDQPPPRPSPARAKPAPMQPGKQPTRPRGRPSPDYFG